VPVSPAQPALVQEVIAILEQIQCHDDCEVAELLQTAREYTP
jgi:hypothetical protein